MGDPDEFESRANELPAGWAMVTVADAGAVRLGRQRSPNQLSGEFPTPYVRAANITPSGLSLDDLLEMNFTPAEREVFALRAGDVLLTEASGSASQVGRAAIWRGEVQPCCYQNTVIRFRPHLVMPEYALVVFRQMATAGTFARAARGVGIQHLGASRFAALDFRLPPLSEQRRIVEIADRRLAEIREAESHLRSALAHLSEQVNETLAAAVAGELVDQSTGEDFVDVAGPTKRKMPDEPDLFQENDHAPDVAGFDAPLPTGWRWSRIDQAGEVTLGRQRSPRHERGRYMRPYLRVANVYEDRIDTSDVLRMNFEPAEAAIYTLREGDILLNEGQSPDLVGRPAMYRGEVPGACFQNTLIRFRAAKSVIPEYALLVFRHYLHSGLFRRTARWSTNIAHLGLERFRALPIPLPPPREQVAIVAEANRRLQTNRQQTNFVTASLGRLQEIEQELFAAAVAGELAAQDPREEPATELIARLGSPPTGTSTKAPKRPQGLIMSKRKPGPSQQAEPTPDLVAVLRESGGRLPLPDLFGLAGYNRDLPEHVELFYLALRSAIGVSIRAASDGLIENAEVEIADAAR